MRGVWILVLLAFVSTQARYTSQESSEEENVILSERDSSIGSSESDEALALDYFRFKRDLGAVQGYLNDDAAVKRDLGAVQGYMNDDATVTGDDNTNDPDGDTATRRPPRRRGGNRRNSQRGSGNRRSRCRPGDNSRRCSRTRRPPSEAPTPETIV